MTMANDQRPALIEFGQTCRWVDDAKTFGQALRLFQFVFSVIVGRDVNVAGLDKAIRLPSLLFQIPAQFITVSCHSDHFRRARRLTTSPAAAQVVPQVRCLRSIGTMSVFPGLVRR